MNQREAEYLALLVHKGFVPERAARDALADRQAQESLPALLARRGLLPLPEAERLYENRVGTAPPVLTRYEVGERLGEGATAAVYSARDRTTAEEVAIKVLHEEVARQPAKLQRFVAEGQLLCRLRHPGIVGGKRVAKDRGTVFLVMERIHGQTLEEKIAKGAKLDELAALRIVHQVAEVLAYLKSERLVHRDLKPGNLMLVEDGRAVLIDLGFAAAAGGRESSTTVGTVDYIAPEQARGEADLDSRADIYSLGATLYHLVVGEPPFSGEARQDVLLQQVFTEISSEKIKALGLSPRLHYFIEKMMAKDRTIRYQEPAEIVADLEEKLGPDLRPPAAPPARRPHTRRLSRRHRR